MGQAQTRTEHRAQRQAPLLQGLEPDARGLMRRAVAALARREHSRAELERKLQDLVRRERARDRPQDRSGEQAQAAACAAEIAQVLDLLQSQDLLSDLRMAQALVRSRAARYGRRRIAQELERRGVDRETIAACLPAAPEESAAAHALWQRKFGKPPASLQERVRQSRYLASRGFAPALIARIVSSAGDAD